jgi:hypothetical protein
MAFHGAKEDKVEFWVKVGAKHYLFYVFINELIK